MTNSNPSTPLPEQEVELLEGLSDVLAPNGWDKQHFEDTGEFRLNITITLETIEALAVVSQQEANRQKAELLDKLKTKASQIDSDIGCMDCLGVDRVISAIEAERNNLKGEEKL